MNEQIDIKNNRKKLISLRVDGVKHLRSYSARTEETKSLINMYFESVFCFGGWIAISVLGPV